MRSSMHALSIATSVALSSGVGGASPSFPTAIQDALDLPCRPECTICHRDLDGGYGTLTKDFGNAMLDEGGVVAKDPDTIADALDVLEALGSDVDGDGTPDVDELRVLEDPNTVDGEVQCLPDEPRDDDGGCAVVQHAGLPRLPWFLVGAAVLASGLRRRRRLIRRGE